MFQNASAFDQTLTRDFSGAEDFTDMFHNATNFTNGGQPIKWITSNAKEMTSMFENTNHDYEFENFNTAGVESFARMFAGNTAFQGSSLLNWDTHSAIDMSSFFDGCEKFRGDLVNFDVSRVTTLRAAFRGASSWSSDISNWNTTMLEDLSFAFEGCSLLNQNLEAWTTSRLRSITAAFRDATNFLGFLSTWDVSRVSDFTSLFEGATRFDGNVAPWNMTGAKTIKAMFKDASTFNRNLNPWAVDGILDMTDAFSGARSFNQSLCWKLNERVLLSGIFSNSQACFVDACVPETLLDSYECGGEQSVDQNTVDSEGNGGNSDNSTVNVAVGIESSGVRIHYVPLFSIVMAGCACLIVLL